MLTIATLTIPGWALAVAGGVLPLVGFLAGLVAAAYRHGKRDGAEEGRLNRIEQSLEHLTSTVDARLTGIARSVAQLDDRMADVSKTLADHHARLRVLEDRTRAA